MVKLIFYKVIENNYCKTQYIFIQSNSQTNNNLTDFNNNKIAILDLNLFL
jgi:hypothetical protein